MTLCQYVGKVFAVAMHMRGPCLAGWCQRAWFLCAQQFTVAAYALSAAVATHQQVELDQLCLHTCSIVGAGGSFWPAPTFRIEAADRAHSIIEAKSPTGAWNAVLQRINLEIERRCALASPLESPATTRSNLSLQMLAVGASHTGQQPGLSACSRSCHMHTLFFVLLCMSVHLDRISLAGNRLAHASTCLAARLAGTFVLPSRPFGRCVEPLRILLCVSLCVGLHAALIECPLSCYAPGGRPGRHCRRRPRRRLQGQSTLG